MDTEKIVNDIDAFFVRELSCTKTSALIKIELWLPVEYNNNYWLSLLRITANGTLIGAVDKIVGVDKFQSFIIALQRIKSVIEYEYPDASFSDMEPGRIGFPSFDPNC